MVTSLTPSDDAPKPKILRDAGNAVEEEPEKDGLSKAASEMGKKGGEAAAKARKEAKAAEEKDDATSEEEEIAEAEKLEKEGKLGKPRHDAKARMLQLARDKKEAKAEAVRERGAREATERRLADLERRQAPPAKEEPRVAAPADGKPKVEDFERYEDFVEALADYKAEAKIKSFREEGAKNAHASERAQRINKATTAFFERTQKAAEADPSWKEKTVDFAGELRATFMLGKDEPVSNANYVADEILISEHSPALMMHFAEHREEFQRLCALSSRADMVREIGRIEGRFSAAPTATAPRNEVSKASPPVRPVAGSPHIAGESELEESAPLSAFVRRFGQKQLSSR